MGWVSVVFALPYCFRAADVNLPRLWHAIPSTGRVPRVTWATTGLSPTDRFEEDPSRATVFETIGREMNKFLDELSCAARLYDFEPIVIRESRVSFLEHAPLRRDSSLLYEQRPVVVHAVHE
jgi:hypothetical protein